MLSVIDALLGRVGETDSTPLRPPMLSNMNRHGFVPR